MYKNSTVKYKTTERQELTCTYPCIMYICMHNSECMTPKWKLREKQYRNFVKDEECIWKA